MREVQALLMTLWEVGGEYHRVKEDRVWCLEAVTYLSICWFCISIGNEYR